MSIEDDAHESMLLECRRARGLETGGILVGHYGDLLDRAVIIEATAPPADSVPSTMSFIRGIAGLFTLLDRRWKLNRHYVGEWHFHPNASPRPSGQDIRQMRKFAGIRSYRCPRPVLIIIGGNQNDGFALSVSVVDADGLVHLSPARVGSAPVAS